MFVSWPTLRFINGLIPTRVIFNSNSELVFSCIIIECIFNALLTDLQVELQRTRNGIEVINARLFANVLSSCALRPFVCALIA